MNAFDNKPLKIVHVLRAPIGGLFRHVLDLVQEQIARGHNVGLIVDQLTGGKRAEEVLTALAPSLKLGVMRLPIHRAPHPTDILAVIRITRRLAQLVPDVVHGHGAKGGLYARAPALLGFNQQAIRAYTPHGGSLNYKPGTRANALFMRIERMLSRSSDVLLFESAYIAQCYNKDVGPRRSLQRVIVNGVSPGEFIPVTPDDDAADLFYIGELRSAKGIDTLLDSLPLIAKKIGRAPKLVLVGSGPDREMLAERAQWLGCAEQVRFAGLIPAREAFRLGKILVVPSRAESLPYVVLEAAGAHVPMVATNVGGIPEIFGPYASRLIPCNDPVLLSEAITEQLSISAEMRAADAEKLSNYVGEKFTLSHMFEGVLAGYLEAIARKNAKLSAQGLPLHTPAE